MKTADLTVGDVVYVCLPYDGGRGYAEVLSLRPGHVRVRFLPGEAGATRLREREVRADRVWHKLDNRGE